MAGVKYSITIPDATKDGEVVIFSVQTKTSVSGGTESGKVVLRQYEDFEYLLHCLTVKLGATAVLLPPLPPKPAVSAAASKAKVTVAGTLYGDEYAYDCKRLQKFIQDIADHPAVGDDELLALFLTEDLAPPRASVRKGMFNSLASKLDMARFLYFKDVDEEFQEIRDNVNLVLQQMKSSNLAKEKYLTSTRNHAAQYGNVAMECRSSFINLESNNSRILTRYLGQFSEILDDYKLKLLSASLIEKETVGFSIDLYSRYLLACQEMLFGRTCKLVEADNASKALEKAKPKFREQLFAEKEEATLEFERISSQSKTEFDRFTECRISHFQASLSELADRRTKYHTSTSSSLRKVIAELKSLL